MSNDRIPLLFTPQQLDYIANALGARPWVEVQSLITDIGEQVKQHNAERNAPVIGTAGAPLPTIEHPNSAVQ